MPSRRNHPSRPVRQWDGPAAPPNRTTEIRRHFRIKSYEIEWLSPEQGDEILTLSPQAIEIFSDALPEFVVSYECPTSEVKWLKHDRTGPITAVARLFHSDIHLFRLAVALSKLSQLTCLVVVSSRPPRRISGKAIALQDPVACRSPGRLREER